MKQSNLALSLVLLTLGILILTLCVSLSGCEKYRTRDYDNDHHNGIHEYYNEHNNDIYEHHCGDEITTVSPPALSVTPRTVRPRFRFRPEPPVYPVPIVPPLVAPETSALFNADVEIISAYATFDKPIDVLAAE